jgi:flavin-dependent dehydrogenase
MQTVVIIGGGPVGALAATLLRARGLKVTLVHRPYSKSYKAGETLPPVANSLLRHLGVYDLLEQEGHIKCPGNQSAFGSPDLVDFDFIYTANGLGWHLDRCVFECQLLDRAQAAGALILNEKIQTVQRKGRQWHLKLGASAGVFNSERFLTADYLVDASGVSRYLLRQQNIPIEHSDKLGARIAIFKTVDENRDHRTLTEADYDGWWYSSCAPSGVRLVMFFSDSDLKGFQGCRTPEAFLERIKQTCFIKQKLEYECPDYKETEAMFLYSEPARSTLSSRVQGEKWIAIGDAAMSFDPLSSQGLWIGFESARRATDAVAEQLFNNSDGAELDYQVWAGKTYSDYRREKKKYYAMEHRFSNEEFWQRRHQI